MKARHKVPIEIKFLRIVCKAEDPGMNEGTKAFDCRPDLKVMD